MMTRGYKTSKTVKRAIRVKELIDSGKTESQILDEMQISKDTLKELCKVNGCEWWLNQPLKIRDPERYAQFIDKCRQAAIDQHETSGNKVSETEFAGRIKERSSGRWEYVDGYAGVDSRVNCKCTTCGAIRSFSGKTIRAYNGMNAPCSNCVSIKNKLDKESRIAWGIIKNRKTKKISGEQIGLAFCKNCGELILDGKRKTFCSIRCQKSDHNRTHDRRLDGKIIDKDISLEKLYDRDHGICYLCGGKCDWDDYEERDGTWIVGKTYPTIEHVIPLCDGGKHSWSNIKLAHHACNSKKGRHPLGEM